MPDQIELAYFGSKAGYERMLSMFRCGQISDLFGIEIRAIRWEPETLTDEIRKSNEDVEEVVKIEQALNKLDIAKADQDAKLRDDKCGTPQILGETQGCQEV